MSELVEKLRAAIDEDERVAREALYHPRRWDSTVDDHVIVGADDGEWKADGCVVGSATPYSVPGEGFQDAIMIYDEGGHTEGQAAHIARYDPARVLRQVTAMRKVLDIHKTGNEAWPEAARPEHPDRHCVGCGFDSMEEYMVEDVNDCPVLLALAEAYGIEVE